MRKITLMIAFLLSIGFSVVAQNANVYFSPEADNYARLNGQNGIRISPTEPGGLNFIAPSSLPPVTCPCDYWGLPPDQIQYYQDLANQCCCRTGTCYYDEDCCVYIMYVFYPTDWKCYIYEAVSSLPIFEM